VPLELAIVVPVFNESENVRPLAEEVLAALTPTGRSFELILVDDASTDDTWAQIQAEQARDSRVRGIRHLKNAGQSAAVWTGFSHSTTPLLATLDGDRQNDPADLPKLLLELKDCDFVCGKRTQRQDTWVRKVSSRIARWARKVWLGADFEDTGCAVRVFKREVIADLTPFNGLHRFLPILVQANGARTKEIPVNHRPRVAGISKYGVWNRVWRGMHDLVGVSWYLKRRLKRTPVEFHPPTSATR
jgi:dolichol-phosphate mannosyltransferase